MDADQVAELFCCDIAAELAVPLASTSFGESRRGGLQLVVDFKGLRPK